jgi:hypothetical protein
MPLSEAAEEACVPRVLPVGWEPHRGFPGYAWTNTLVGSPMRGVSVMLSAGVEEDGRGWLHVSLSRAGRIPSWEDCCVVKALFIGEERWAYQVLAPRSEHFTLPDGPGRLGKVLHLWAPLDGEPRLPNFLRARGGTL